MSKKILINKFSKSQQQFINRMFSVKWMSPCGKELTKEMYIKILLKMKKNKEKGASHEY